MEKDRWKKSAQELVIKEAYCIKFLERCYIELKDLEIEDAGLCDELKRFMKDVYLNSRILKDD